VVEIIGFAGAEAVVIHAGHEMIGAETMRSMLVHARSASMPAIFRPRRFDAAWCRQGSRRRGCGDPGQPCRYRPGGGFPGGAGVDVGTGPGSPYGKETAHRLQISFPSRNMSIAIPASSTPQPYHCAALACRLSLLTKRDSSSKMSPDFRSCCSAHSNAQFGPSPYSVSIK
jgi:hypothetical protein